MQARVEGSVVHTLQVPRGAHRPELHHLTFCTRYDSCMAPRNIRCEPHWCSTATHACRCERQHAYASTSDQAHPGQTDLAQFVSNSAKICKSFDEYPPLSQQIGRGYIKINPIDRQRLLVQEARERPQQETVPGQKWAGFKVAHELMLLTPAAIQKYTYRNNIM